MDKVTHSLRGLLLRRLWLPLLLLLLASAIGSFVLARHYANQVYDRWLLDSAMSLAQLIDVRDQRAYMQVPEAVSRMFSWDTVDQVYGEVIGASGKRLYGQVPIPGGAGSGPRGHGREPRYGDAVVAGHRVRVVTVAFRPAASAETVQVRVAETLTKRHRLMRRLLLTSIPLQATVLLLAAWLAWSGTGSAARHTNGVARRLASTQLDALIPLDPSLVAPRELWPAVHAFNELVSRLKAMQEAQHRFISNAAHQLRTPLAGMQVELESTLRETDPRAQRQALDGLLRNLTRLRHLTQQLLVLSRSEAAADDMLALRAVDVAELARSVLERLTDRAVQEQIDLGYEGPDQGAIVLGEPQLLSEAIANLVDNAMRYGAPRGTVTVAIDLERDQVRLRVDDNGRGIAEHARKRVTERFYRGESGGDGCGLGLAIVAEIARRHGATLQIAAAPSGGARVAMVFNRARPGVLG